MLRNQHGSGKLVFLILGVLGIISIGLIVWGFGVSNDEIRLRNKFEAQDKVIEAFFDKMWKIIRDQAGVADKYQESFRGIYKDLMAGRDSGEGKGQMMLWIKEQNPQFDTSLFDKLMVSIEAQREGFFVEQKKIVDIAREHKNLIEVAPSSWIVGSRAPLVYEVISSTHSKEVMKSRVDDSPSPFEKKAE